MGLFGGGGEVGPTPQEKALASTMMAQWQDYQTRWLPVQQHLANVVNDMENPQSWQKQEAEGKGNVDVSAAFAQRMNQQTVSKLAQGINPGSPAFKLATASGAVAEAASKGMAIEEGNRAIDRAYVENLSAIARSGQKLAGTASQGMGVAGEVGSREAISSAQVENAKSASIMGAVGFGLGAAGQALGGGGGGGGIAGSTTPPEIANFQVPNVDTSNIMQQVQGIATSVPLNIQ